MYISSASSPSTVLWAFDTIQPSSYVSKQFILLSTSCLQATRAQLCTDWY